MAHAKSFGTVWRASDSFNVVRLTPERRERADRQRALASAYRLEAAVAHIPADVRPAVVQAVAKALKQQRPDAFRRLPWPWCERLLEWWDLRIETKRKARGRRAVADFAVIAVCGKQHPCRAGGLLRTRGGPFSAISLCPNLLRPRA
jgi:hypothetical protein